MPDWIDGYTWLWAIWILYFAAVETHALLSRSDTGTLSAHIWAIFGVHRDDHGQFMFSWGRLIILGAMTLLTTHFMFGFP